ncbi:hypothetical protein [Senegalia massiliensis]|uniref:Uncharacterized protein n=1 Tax=Senegalia massiliensis TaxID=1720316 RepID=A0A845QUI2_9CLOT|nr:hypothetical protein [Senegalia massiliensis]NBI05459.1 hypothetical protein [Senegalia massiliensis]
MSKDIIEKIINSASTMDALKNNKNVIRNYQLQLMLSTIKSLIPSEDKKGIRIYYPRFIKEMELLKYYIYNTDKNKTNNYYKYKDSNFTARIIPIVITNSDFDIAREEIIKNILFFTGNIKSLLSGILLGKLLDRLINGEYKKEEILKNLKNEIINFSQTEFLKKYKEYYRIDLEEYEGNYTINFEKERINLINTLNDISYNDDIIKKSILIIENHCEVDSTKINDIFLLSVLGVYSEEINKIEYNDKKFMTKISDYLVKLRKGRIDPSSLNINMNNIPNLFDSNQGDIIDHPLLNRSKIIKKYYENDTVTIEVMTKSGLYIFQK